MRRNSTRGVVFTRTLCATLVAAALLAGCSGGGDVSNSGPSGAPPVAAPPVGAPAPGGSPAPAPAPGNLPPPPQMVGPFWSGVSLMDNATTLAKAATLFAGRNPSAAEIAAASANDAVLRTTIRSYLQGP